MNRQSFGKHKFTGTLEDAKFSTLFGAPLVSGMLGAERFSAVVLCFDGRSDDRESFVWTDKGRVRVKQSDRSQFLLGE